MAAYPDGIPVIQRWLCQPLTEKPVFLLRFSLAVVAEQGIDTYASGAE
jgi:hypothetical protein